MCEYNIIFSYTTFPRYQKNNISNVERHEVKLELKSNVCQKLEKL